MPLTKSKQIGANRSTTLRNGLPHAAGRWNWRLRAGLPGVLAWAVPFGTVLGVLLYRNAFLFRTPLYEDADPGANSILIEQARRLTLLVGHYSREGFNHPGPAFLYVQAWGEQLFWAALHVVPTAWNGQLITVYALNAVFIGLIVAISYRWSRSAWTAAACLAALLALAAARPPVVSSDWMPYLLVPAFLTFLVASASVAAGQVRHTWIAALAGGFLVNGNVAFLFFVPLLAAAPVAAIAWRHRGFLLRRLPHPRLLYRALVASAAAHRAVWLPAAVIGLVFAFPIALDTALHWPGEFGKYLSYSASARAGGHSVSQLTDYLLWFWWPHALGWLGPALCYLAAGAVAWWLMKTSDQVYRLAVGLVCLAAVANAAFVIYAMAGIDELDQAGHFIGYFFWSVPAALLLVIAIGVTEALTRCPGGKVTAAALTAAAAVLACAAFAAAPLTRTSVDHVDPLDPVASGPLASGPAADPGIAAAVTRLARLAEGRTLVLLIGARAWPAMTGLLVQAERVGVAACVASPAWTVMVTSQFICTPVQLATGRHFLVQVPGAVSHGMPVLAWLRRGIVTATTK
jgi:hypothetical protein